MVNTPDSTFGKAELIGKKMIIPYKNVQIMENNDHFLKNFSGMYIAQCYLVFEGIQSITWDYDFSRNLNSDLRECYGGINYFDNEYYEFWIIYENGYVLIDSEWKITKDLVDLNTVDTHSFFESKIRDFKNN